MVGHQAEGNHRGDILILILLQKAGAKFIIVFIEENRLLIDSTVEYVIIIAFFEHIFSIGHKYPRWKQPPAGSEPAGGFGFAR